MTPDWVGAFFIGLIGAGHCMGMCGGIASLLSIGSQKPSPMTPLLYNLGRLSSYALIGAIVGGAISSIGELSQFNALLGWLRLFTAIFMIILALYIGKWWFGLLVFEKLGQRLWRYISPIGKSFLPLKHPSHALPFGFIWGWLPCGLVYSMLTWAAVSGSSINGAGIMLAFGLGTLPAMLAVGVGANLIKRIQQATLFRQLGAVLIFIYGLYTGYIAIQLINYTV
ncbi:sulfite exporter TauE/SafE family protein [Vibrio gallaecicus]|uniref:Sulfite exporter TauE/SafE family protein n=1 Tax=Vibrio gallaecicus TaxID=552386 RepID=A0ABV4N6P0_9VIBR